MNSQPLVSAIVCNYNGAHLLPDCLSTLKKQDYPNLEILVIDNGSFDESREVTENFEVPFIYSGGNFGLAFAYNRGAEIAKGEYLFFLNNDLRFEVDCVSQLISAMQGKEDLFCADPLQYNWEGTEVIHYREVLRRIEHLKQIFSAILLPKPFLILKWDPCDEIVDIPFACAGSMMVERRKFEVLQGFDTTFFLDYEDVDICWRAWQRGWRTIYVPQAQLYHNVGSTSPKKLKQQRPEIAKKLSFLPRRRLIGSQKNHQRFILKTQKPTAIARFIFIRLLSIFLYPLVRQPERSLAILKAFWLNLKELPEIMQERKRIQRISVMHSQQLIQHLLDISRR